MGNAAGVFAVLAAFARPGIVVPHAVVADIGEIDWQRIRSEGVEDVVIDKDNCVTLPHRDGVAPGLESAWERLTNAGFRTILIVSNSAGSSDDPLAVGAEHLARTLGQSVLAHPSKKPAMACARQIVDVFDKPERFETSYTTPNGVPRLVAVVGDRITTDIVLASRLNTLLQRRNGGRAGAIGILTTRVLEPERLLTRLMRSLEMWCLSRLDGRGVRPGQGWTGVAHTSEGQKEWQDIVQDEEVIQRATELEAASQIRPDIRQLFLQKSQELLISSARGLGMITKITALFLVRHVYRFGSHALYLATRGRIGAPTSFPSLPVLRRPYRSRPLAPAPPHKALASGKRPFSTYRVPSPASVRRYRHSQASQKLHTRSPPRFTTAQKVGYFSALVLVPTCWFGGVYLHDYLDMRRQMAEQAAQGGDELDRAVVHDYPQPIAGPVSAKVPSLANAAAATSRQHEFEIQSLRTERLHMSRELSELDDKLARVRQRQERVV